jgi:hypothetical protein
MRGDEAVIRDEGPTLVEVRNLEGVPVFSRSGAKLGELEGLFIAKQSGAIDYVVLRRSSFLGLRRKRCLLRWDALLPNAGRGGFALAGEAPLERSQPAEVGVDCPLRLDPARTD